MGGALYTPLPGLVGSMHAEGGGQKGPGRTVCCGTRRQAACNLGTEVPETQEYGIWKKSDLYPNDPSGICRVSNPGPEQLQQALETEVTDPGQEHPVTLLISLVVKLKLV